MRRLDYIAIGFTSMLTAAAFAQALNGGIKEGPFMQAQAGGPMSGQGQMGQNGSGSMDRMNEQGKPDVPTVFPAESGKGKDKGGYHAKDRKAKRDQPRDSSSQVRKDSKQQPKDSGG
jgi:hypothetical protein